MTKFHHRKLPSFSALLSGPTPRNELGFRSKQFQINYFNTEEAWTDPLPHAHQEGVECFIVFQGTIIVEVEGERVMIGPSEFCGFPKGTFHQVVEVRPPIECLILRAPTGADKIYMLPDGTLSTENVYQQDILGLLNKSDENSKE